MIELIRRPPEKFSSDEDSAEGESKEDSEDEDYHFKKGKTKLDFWYLNKFIVKWNLDIKWVDDKSVNELREIQIKYQNKPHKLLFSQKYQGKWKLKQLSTIFNIWYFWLSSLTTAYNLLAHRNLQRDRRTARNDHKSIQLHAFLRHLQIKNPSKRWRDLNVETATDRKGKRVREREVEERGKREAVERAAQHNQKQPEIISGTYKQISIIKNLLIIKTFIFNNITISNILLLSSLLNSNYTFLLSIITWSLIQISYILHTFTHSFLPTNSTFLFINYHFLSSLPPFSHS